MKNIQYFCDKNLWILHLVCIIIKVEEEVPYNMLLTYYLITNSVSEEYCDLKVYGVEIDKKCPYEKDSEKKLITDLFFQKDEAEIFLEKLVDNQVTPMGLKYAVREYIGERLNVCSVKDE